MATATPDNPTNNASIALSVEQMGMCLKYINSQRKFDGNPMHLCLFVKNIDASLSLFYTANPIQMTLQLNAVKGLLIGDAMRVLMKASYETWSTLRTALLNHFEDRTPLHQLIASIRTTKYKGDLSKFINDLEFISNRVMNRLNLSGTPSEKLMYQSSLDDFLSQCIYDELPERILFRLSRSYISTPMKLRQVAMEKGILNNWSQINNEYFKTDLTNKSQTMKYNQNNQKQNFQSIPQNPIPMYTPRYSFNPNYTPRPHFSQNQVPIQPTQFQQAFPQTNQIQPRPQFNPIQNQNQQQPEFRVPFKRQRESTQQRRIEPMDIGENFRLQASDNQQEYVEQEQDQEFALIPNQINQETYQQDQEYVTQEQNYIASEEYDQYQTNFQLQQ